MKNKQQIVNLLGGLNELQPQNPDHLTELSNWKTDDLTGGWSSKIGYEKFFTYMTTWAPFASMKKVDSLYYFSRHQGAQTSIIFEAGGVLYHLFEWGNVIAASKKQLVASRTIPKITENSTQYLQFGRFLCMVNGFDRPIKYRAWPVVSATNVFTPAVYPLGFHRTPGTPNALNVAVDPTAASNSVTDGVCIQFSAVDELGLGIGENNKSSSYKWRVSFINNAGSESPLSPASATVTWTADANAYRYACAVEIPLGDSDTIARRIYRTKNFSSDGGADGSLYYFVIDIPNNYETLYIDDHPDFLLGALAPSDTDSVVFPSLDCRFMDIYKDCLFIDGGRSNNTLMYFSNPSRPDQFGALNFITVGNRSGGGITGFFGYFGYLLVFRESSIDVVQGDFPNFVATPFQQHIGTTATDTLTMVPGLGVLFLASDGVYAIGGNLEYSDTTNVKKISHQIQDTLARMNVTALPQATAIYSEKHREWHCYFAVDGSDVNNFGIVYHLDKQAWSVREGFPVNKLVKTPSGDILFGTTDTAGTADDPAGLFAISRIRALGQKIDEGSMVDNGPPTSVMASAWLDMGDPSLKKKVHGVYLFIRTGGDTTISMEVYRDYDYNSYETTQGIKQQRADFADQNVYDVVALDDGKYWEEPMVTPIRFDVHNGSCSWFRWRFSTDVDVVVVGYAVDFTAGGTRIIAGKKL